jgi:hypothetical protein
MTPTLFGRWQIRLFMLSTVGLVIACLIGWTIGNLRLPLLALGFVLMVGCILDVLYQYIQSFRWDCDWPTSFQMCVGVLEGLLVCFLIEVLNGSELPTNFPTVFVVQYGSTWLMIFALTQGPLRLLWPKWRYQGGQWLRFPARREAGIPSTSASPSVLAQAHTPLPDEIDFAATDAFADPSTSPAKTLT